jgi:hypothetical protein
LDPETKARTIARIAERQEQESKGLRYRWGYFQGAILIPWSLLLIYVNALNFRAPHYEPLYISVIGILIGLIGLPLSFGLLWKRRFGLTLVYVVSGLALLLLAIKLSIAIAHYRDQSEYGSAMSEAESLLIWLCSMVYYKKRQSQFR